MKRLLLLILLISSSSLVWSEPKPYQQALIDEPLSIMDFMIYKNRVRLEEYVNDWILDPEAKSYPKRQHWDSPSYQAIFYEYDWFEWETPQDKSIPFVPPLLKRQTSLEFNWKDGTFDVEQQWQWQYNHHLFIPDQKGRIKTTSANIAKICELQLYEMSTYTPLSSSHEGYTTSDFENKTENLFSQIQKDTRVTVHIAVFGSYATKDFTYLECSSGISSIRKNDASKIEYSYIGNWHQLEEISKKRSSPIK